MVRVQVIQSFYDRSYGMKFRKQGEVFEETPERANELFKKGLVIKAPDTKTKAAAEK